MDDIWGVNWDFSKSLLLELVMNKGKDLKQRLVGMIKEELISILQETEYRYGRLLDPENMDPIDPEVNVVGYGTMARSQLRSEITRRMEGAVQTAKQAEGNESDRAYKNLEMLFDPKGVLTSMIKAELDVSQQLEAIRTKGGRRTIPIPKQT